jgi:hypothetical protein
MHLWIPHATKPWEVHPLITLHSLMPLALPGARRLSPPHAGGLRAPFFFGRGKLLRNPSWVVCGFFYCMRALCWSSSPLLLACGQHPGPRIEVNLSLFKTGQLSSSLAIKTMTAYSPLLPGLKHH